MTLYEQLFDSYGELDHFLEAYVLWREWYEDSEMIWIEPYPLTLVTKNGFTTYTGEIRDRDELVRKRTVIEQAFKVHKTLRIKKRK